MRKKAKPLVRIANRTFQACSGCEAWKGIDDCYHVSRQERTGRQRKCKACYGELSKQKYVEKKKAMCKGKKVKMEWDDAKDRPLLKVEKESYRWFQRKGHSIKEIAKEHNRAIEHVEKELEAIR